jgi:ketosteroid isomerase-like protein
VLPNVRQLMLRGAARRIHTVHEDAALRFLSAVNAFDRATVESMLAVDARWISPRATIEGREALMQALTDMGAPGSKLDELTVSLADRTIEEKGDTVTTTVRRDYHWTESGEFSHSMVARTALTFREGKIAVVEESAPERVDER